MVITTYSFAKDKKSTKRPSSGGTNYNIVLKENTSVDNPTFILTHDGVPTFDYCHWIFGYYFVEDIKLQSKDVYEINCKLDVLATYRDDILNSTQFVLRSTSDYSLDIKDTEILPKLNQSKTELDTNCSLFDEFGSYIVRIIGKGSVNNFRSYGISTFVVNTSELTRLINKVFDNQIFNKTSPFDLSDVTEVLKCLFCNPSSYLLSINWIPVDAGLLGVLSEEVHFGYYPTTITCTLLQQETVENTTVLNTFTRVFGDFRDFDENFTQFELSLPCVGIIPINASDAYSGLTVKTYIETLTGTLIYNIFRNDNNALIGKYKTNINCTIQIGGVTHGLSTGSLTSLVTSTAKDLVTPKSDVIGNIGSRAEITYDNDFRFTRRIFGSTDSPIFNKGKPLNEYRQLSNVQGYCECRNPKIDTTAYGLIKDEILNYMEEGFFIE